MAYMFLPASRFHRASCSVRTCLSNGDTGESASIVISAPAPGSILPSRIPLTACSLAGGLGDRLNSAFNESPTCRYKWIVTNFVGIDQLTYQLGTGDIYSTLPVFHLTLESQA